MQSKVRPVVTVILFVVTLLGLGLLNLIADKPVVSASEQRYLKPMPTLSAKRLQTGVVFREFDEFFGDRFIWRDGFVQTGKGLMVWRGLPGTNEPRLVVAQGKGTQPPTRQGQTEATPQAGSAAYNPDTPLLILPDRVMEVYKFQPEGAERYAGLLNRLRERLPEDVSLYSLIAPMAIEYYNVPRYQSISSSQGDALFFIKGLLAAGVTPIEVHRALQEQANDYIYFRSDHHWTALGAYYAYAAFMEQTGREPIPLDQFRSELVMGFLGTTHSRTLSRGLERNPDVVWVYRPPVTAVYEIHTHDAQVVQQDMFDLNWAVGAHKYGIFLSGDVPFGKITTSVENGRRIVVIKDSYANAFIPYLASHYQEIYILDPRESELSVLELLAEHDIKEVLLLNYIKATGVGSYLNQLEQLIER